MYPREKIIYDELEYQINKIVNNYKFIEEFPEDPNLININNITNIELINMISGILTQYRFMRKIYDYKVNCNYPNLEIYIHIFKGGEIFVIKPLRFERLKKLKKLSNIQ